MVRIGLESEGVLLSASIVSKSHNLTFLVEVTAAIIKSTGLNSKEVTYAGSTRIVLKSFPATKSHISS